VPTSTKLYCRGDLSSKVIILTVLETGFVCNSLFKKFWFLEDTNIMADVLELDNAEEFDEEHISKLKEKAKR